MQPTLVHRRDMRLVVAAAVVAVGAILIAVAWTLWPSVTSTTTPSTLPAVTSPSTAGMGDLRAVDIVNSSGAGMGDLRAVEALGGRAVGMGDLRVFEREITTMAPMARPVGMGDVRADSLPGGSTQKTPYVGMGDVQSAK